MGSEFEGFGLIKVLWLAITVARELIVRYYAMAGKIIVKNDFMKSSDFDKKEMLLLV